MSLAPLRTMTNGGSSRCHYRMALSASQEIVLRLCPAGRGCGGSVSGRRVRERRIQGRDGEARKGRLRLWRWLSRGVRLPPTGRPGGRYATAPVGNEVFVSMQNGSRNRRAAERAIARIETSKSRPIRRITLRLQPLVIFGRRRRNRLQRRLTKVYSHLTDWDPGELVEIRWNRNISSGRAAAHSS
jgi:hypothetical protein